MSIPKNRPQTVDISTLEAAAPVEILEVQHVQLTSTAGQASFTVEPSDELHISPSEITATIRRDDSVTEFWFDRAKLIAYSITTRKVERPIRH